MRFVTLRALRAYWTDFALAVHMALAASLLAADLSSGSGWGPHAAEWWLSKEQDEEEIARLVEKSMSDEIRDLIDRETMESLLVEHRELVQQQTQAYHSARGSKPRSILKTITGRTKTVSSYEKMPVTRGPSYGSPVRATPASRTSETSPHRRTPSTARSSGGDTDRHLSPFRSPGQQPETPPKSLSEEGPSRATYLLSLSMRALDGRELRAKPQVENKDPILACLPCLQRAPVETLRPKKEALNGAVDTDRFHRLLDLSTDDSILVVVEPPRPMSPQQNSSRKSTARGSPLPFGLEGRRSPSSARDRPPPIIGAVRSSVRVAADAAEEDAIRAMAGQRREPTQGVFQAAWGALFGPVLSTPAPVVAPVAVQSAAPVDAPAAHAGAEPLAAPAAAEPVALPSTSLSSSSVTATPPAQNSSCDAEEPPLLVAHTAPPPPTGVSDGAAAAGHGRFTSYASWSVSAPRFMSYHPKYATGSDTAAATDVSEQTGDGVQVRLGPSEEPESPPVAPQPQPEPPMQPEPLLTPAPAAEDAVARATRIFNQLDTDNSGFVDRDELIAHLKQTVRLSDEMSERVFNALDGDGNHQIELSEWLAVYAKG